MLKCVQESKAIHTVHKNWIMSDFNLVNYVLGLGAQFTYKSTNTRNEAWWLQTASYIQRVDSEAIDIKNYLISGWMASLVGKIVAFWLSQSIWDSRIFNAFWKSQFAVYFGLMQSSALIILLKLATLTVNKQKVSGDDNRLFLAQYGYKDLTDMCFQQDCHIVCVKYWTYYLLAETLKGLLFCKIEIVWCDDFRLFFCGATLNLLST